MRNPLSRLIRRSDAKPTLKERAAALKATAARVIRKPRPLPAPGSDEARALFKAACVRSDRLGHAAVHGYPELRRTALETWTKDTLWRALEAGEMTPAQVAPLYQMAAERELRIDAATVRSQVGALQILAFADTYPVRAEPAEEAVDWHDPPPGFMASPAIEPASFRHLFSGIPDELTRLHGIARADYERRVRELRERLPEAEWPAEEARLRGKLRLDALTAAVDPDSDCARALAALGRRVTGEDPDAELIALGRQFDEAHAAWMALLPASDAAHERIAAFQKRAEAEGMDATAACQAAWLLDGVNEPHAAEERAFEAFEPLNRAIMALPARTLAGVAVKARAAIVAMWPAGEFERDRALGDEEHWERRPVRDLIDACTTLARREAVGGKPSHGRIEKPGEDLRDGTVLYEGITGRLVREPVAGWIGYMAQRLYVVATQESTRQLNRRCDDLDGPACDALWSELQRDLRIDALRDLAFRSYQVFEAAEAGRNGYEPTPDLDASGLQVRQLVNLSDAFERACEVWSDAAHRPWASSCDGSDAYRRNTAGQVADRESTRCAAHRDSLIEELRSREPEDKFEADMRLAAILRYELLCNGDLRADPALRAAIAERWSA